MVSQNRGGGKGSLVKRKQLKYLTFRFKSQFSQNVMHEISFRDLIGFSLVKSNNDLCRF